MTVGKVWRHSSRRPIRRLMSVGGGWNQGGGGGGEGGADDSGSLESGEGSLEEELDHFGTGENMCAVPVKNREWTTTMHEGKKARQQRQQHEHHLQQHPHKNLFLG